MWSCWHCSQINKTYLFTPFLCSCSPNTTHISSYNQHSWQFGSKYNHRQQTVTVCHLTNRTNKETTADPCTVNLCFHVWFFFWPNKHWNQLIPIPLVPPALLLKHCAQQLSPQRWRVLQQEHQTAVHQYLKDLSDLVLCLFWANRIRRRRGQCRRNWVRPKVLEATGVLVHLISLQLNLWWRERHWTPEHAVYKVKMLSYTRIS